MIQASDDLKRLADGVERLCELVEAIFPKEIGAYREVTHALREARKAAELEWPVWEPWIPNNGRIRVRIKVDSVEDHRILHASAHDRESWTNRAIGVVASYTGGSIPLEAEWYDTQQMLDDETIYYCGFVPPIDPADIEKHLRPMFRYMKVKVDAARREWVRQRTEELQAAVYYDHNLPVAKAVLERLLKTAADKYATDK